MLDKSIKIFVPLGTQKFPFNRLIEEFNRLISNGMLCKTDVFIQSAIFESIPLCDHAHLLSNSEFLRHISEADLVVTHCGVNSIITCMKMEKKLIIVPRLKEFGEHVDNHQLEIAHLMHQKFNICTLDKISDLSDLIPKAISHNYKPWIGNPDQLINAIKNIL